MSKHNLIFPLSHKSQGRVSVAGVWEFSRRVWEFFLQERLGVSSSWVRVFFSLDQLVNISLDSVYTMEYYQTINVSFTSFFISIGPYLYCNQQAEARRSNTTLFHGHNRQSNTPTSIFRNAPPMLTCWWHRPTALELTVRIRPERR
jgi:hypothetical protein